MFLVTALDIFLCFVLLSGIYDCTWLNCFVDVLDMENNYKDMWKNYKEEQGISGRVSFSLDVLSQVEGVVGFTSLYPGVHCLIIHSRSLPNLCRVDLIALGLARSEPWHQTWTLYTLCMHIMADWKTGVYRNSQSTGCKFRSHFLYIPLCICQANYESMMYYITVK